MLVLEHIAWNLPDGEPILKDITLTVPDGKLAVVTGPNGGGKTSLAKPDRRFGKTSGWPNFIGRRGYHRIGHNAASKKRSGLCVSAAGTVQGTFGA